MFSSRKLLLLIILLLTAGCVAYLLFVIIPARIAQNTYEGAKQIGEDIRNVFNVTPQISVNNRVVIKEQLPVFELATLSQQFDHEYTWTNTWLNSTKKIKIKGSFLAKVGFDLHQSFTINIDGEEARVTLPPPELLSLTPENDITFEDENGIWNWVDTEDRTSAINDFNRDAKNYAASAPWIQNAKGEIEKRLTEIFSKHGLHVTVRYTASDQLQPG